MRNKVRGMMPDNIATYSKWILNSQAADIYAYLFKTISTTMKSAAADSSIDPIKNGPSALVVISGDSLPAAAFRERANGEFPRDSYLMCAVYGQNIHQGFADFLRQDFEEVDDTAGWPILICWRGGAVVRYLDFQVYPKAFKSFFEKLIKDAGSEDGATQILRDVRDYMRLKWKKT